MLSTCAPNRCRKWGASLEHHCRKRVAYIADDGGGVTPRRSDEQLGPTNFYRSSYSFSLSFSLCLTPRSAATRSWLRHSSEESCTVQLADNVICFPCPRIAHTHPLTCARKTPFDRSGHERGLRLHSFLSVRARLCNTLEQYCQKPAFVSAHDMRH